MRTITHTSNNDEALLDGLTTGWVLANIADAPEMLAYFDVAAIIEAIVLHERVNILFPTGLNEMEQMFRKRVEEAFSSLIKARAIDIVEYNVPYMSDNEATASNKLIKRNDVNHLDAEKDFAAWMIFATISFAAQERQSVGNTIILPCQHLIHKLNMRVRVEHAISNFYLNYKSVGKLVQLAVQAQKGLIPDEKSPINFHDVPIPPLRLDALSRSQKPEDIWVATGELWAEHATLRQLHQRLMDHHGLAELSPAQKEREAKSLVREWNNLLTKWTNRVTTFKLADTTTNLQQESGLLRNFGGISLSLPTATSPLGVGLDPVAWARQIKDLYDLVSGHWKFRKIHNSLEAYWRINDFDIYKQFERLTKRPVTTEDHRNIMVADEEDNKDHNIVITRLFPD